jgi:hypothetical protein
MFGTQRPKVGRKVRWSGVSGGVNCGNIKHTEWTVVEGHVTDLVVVQGPAAEGDSGGPVWNPYTEEAVGTISAISPTVKKPCQELSTKVMRCPRMLFSPLLQFGKHAIPAGIVATLGVEVLRNN